MDRLYNNEALLSCTIMKMLSFGGMDYARLSLSVPLVVDDGLRETLCHCHSDREAFIAEVRNNTMLLLNRKYLDYQPTILNSLVILAQGNLLDYDNGMLSLHGSHIDFLESFNTINSDRLHDICSSISELIGMFSETTNEELFSLLNIEL